MAGMAEGLLTLFLRFVFFRFDEWRGGLETGAGLAGRAERYRSGQTGQTVNLLA